MKIIIDIKSLRQKSEPVTNFWYEHHRLIRQLEQSLDTTKGIGLSAIQIGINKRIGIIRIGNRKINLINPEIVERSCPFRYEKEGCLSLPNVRVDTRRYNEVTILNNNKEEKYMGIVAIAIQHEVAHMNGRTILDDKWRKKK